MKKFISVSTIFWIVGGVASPLWAQFRFGLSYNYTQRSGEMRQNFGKTAHSLYVPAYVYIPKLRGLHWHQFFLGWLRSF